MSEELLRKVVERLDTLIELIRNPPNMSNYDPLPWPFKLIQEQTTGIDIDKNGLLWGSDFIFNHPIDAHPPVMRYIHHELSRGWTGKRLSFIDYVKSLPDDAPHRQDVIEHIKKIKAINGGQ